MVAFIYRPEQYKSPEERDSMPDDEKNVAELIVAKQRNVLPTQFVFASHHQACASIICIENNFAHGTIYPVVIRLWFMFHVILFSIFLSFQSCRFR